jgi:hypothetical protein
MKVMLNYHVECSMMEWNVVLSTVPCPPPLPQLQRALEVSSTIMWRSSEDRCTWKLALLKKHDLVHEFDFGCIFIISFTVIAPN